MKKIWAPWRIEYIRQEKDINCFICEIINDDIKKDKENLLLFRGKSSLVMLNRFPYISGHLMVAPFLHTADITKIPEEVSTEMWYFTRKSVELLCKTFKPEGFNIGINLGKIAGAGLKTHLHIHVVPRWSGDTNFMPILSDTRVISQALNETYDELFKHINVFIQNNSF